MDSTTIGPGDRVEVKLHKNGYYRGTAKATALAWTRTGLLRVQFDKDASVKSVNPDNVKLMKKASGISS